jgi:hypothetical protein
MIRDRKIVFFGQSVFCFLHQLQFFLDEIPVIDDFPAPRADEMVMMVSFVFSLERIAALSVTGGDLMDETQPVQQFQSPIDRRQSYPRVHGIQGPINIFGRQMVLGPAQKSQDDLTGRRPAAGILPETVLPLVSAGQSLTSYR